ncbi:eukaryotic aspartyl protease family protein [Striga asiatica]|uniref:Eukaryotic aspartyl protease family protein n=1 Tax=Striga asiatica TaxID=4170 RepID=A0A5A7R7C2_STRAF|nr:eukaryotic aspartyl protease family protein [Striga asiatica]
MHHKQDLNMLLSVCKIISLLFSSILITFSQASNPEIILARLIHHQSTNSPLYDPNLSVEELAEISLRSSISRGLYLTTNSTRWFKLEDIIEPDFTPAAIWDGFLVRMRVGSNGVDQFLFMDTGSSLIWINCVPSFADVPEPLFDPEASTTHQVENCTTTDICDASGPVIILFPSLDCDINGCSYYVNYGSMHSSWGLLRRETFEFGKTSNDSLTNLVFGCSRKTNLFTNGVLGLGNLRLSLISQYNASRFSYCFGKISDRSYPHSTLVIGSNNIVHGSVFTTPLVIEDDKYYVNMEILMVGERLFKLDPLIFTRNTSEYSDGGVILDTSLSLSFMPFNVVIDIETVYTPLIESLGLTPNTSITYRNTVTRFCYNGVVTRDLTNGFPTMKFVFRGGVVMELEADSVFQQTHNGTFCLAILPSEHVLGVTTTILGTLMQQNFNVVYDIEMNNVSFSKGDCQTVEDYYDVNDEL